MNGGRPLKFLYLGRDAMMRECLADDDVRWKGGKVVVTDGPFAETKEQLGELLVLEVQPRIRKE
jgi:hypothetical protein